ncbi:MAG: 23S rRNA (guanosine(2251)-2'-O)-methyltransferase RlmB [Acidimicrobiales bacterium]
MSTRRRPSPPRNLARNSPPRRPTAPERARPRSPKPRQRGLGGEQVEGRQAVRETLLARRRKVHEIWLANDLDPAPIIDDIVELAHHQRVPVQEVARKRLDAEAHTDAPQGVLAKCAPIREHDLDDLAKRQKGKPLPFLVALDGVTDPGNLGAVLRSADGAGATGIVLAKHRAVHVTPTVAKTAAGAIEYLPMTIVSGIPAALMRLRELGVWIVGLDGDAPMSLFDLPAIDDDPVCVVMGAEGTGLSRLVRQRCDVIVSIPMHGGVAALNVSAAAALACFEVARRRRA